ncbi:hypothetical protein EMCRGX_G026304 [Ephydatia muelleri]
MVPVAMLHGKQLVEKENSNVKLLKSYELNNGYNDQLMKTFADKGCKVSSSFEKNAITKSGDDIFRATKEMTGLDLSWE